MSLFSLSIGDVIAVGTFAWNVYRACKTASGEFEEVAREVNSLHTAIKELEDETSNADSILLRSHERKRTEVMNLLANCRTVLTQLDSLVTKYKKLRSKIAFHTSAINLFLTNLGTGSLGRIEKRLDEIASEIRAGIRDADSVAHLDEHELNASEAELEWNALKDELVQEGFTRQDLEAHKTEIKKRLRELVNGTVHMSTEAIDETAIMYHGSHSTRQAHPMDPATLPLQLSPQFDVGHADEWAADCSSMPLTRPCSRTLKRRASSPIDHPGYPRHNPSSSPGLHRSRSIASLAGSVHSDITTYDGQGRVKRRTITTEWASPEPESQQVLIRTLSNEFNCRHLGCTDAPFQTQDQLDNHANIHVASEMHFCSFRGCPRGPGGRGFEQKIERIRHELGYKNPRYFCPFCQDRQSYYPGPDNLQRHVRIHHLDVDLEDQRLRNALARPLPPDKYHTALEQTTDQTLLQNAEEEIRWLYAAFTAQSELRLRAESMLTKPGLLGDDTSRGHTPPLIADSIDDGTAFVDPEEGERIVLLKWAEYDRIEQRLDELVSKMSSMTLQRKHERR